MDGPEIARVFDGLSTGADECGAEMGFLSGSLNHMADVLRSRTKYQGAVVIEQFDETVLQALWNESIPVVIANLERGGNFPGTRVDYRDIGRRAGRIFFEAGHRKIGFLSGNTSVFIYQEMLAGLKGALAEDDIALNPEWVIQKYGSFDVHEELTALFKSAGTSERISCRTRLPCHGALPVLPGTELADPGRYFGPEFRQSHLARIRKIRIEFF